MAKTDDHTFLFNAPDFHPIDVEELKKFNDRDPEGFNAMMCAYMDHYYKLITTNVKEFLEDEERVKGISSLLGAISIEIGDNPSKKFPHIPLGCYVQHHNHPDYDWEFLFGTYLEGQELPNELRGEFTTHFGEANDDTSRGYWLRSEYGKKWKYYSYYCGIFDSYYWKWITDGIDSKTLLQFLGIEDFNVERDKGEWDKLSSKKVYSDYKSSPMFSILRMLQKTSPLDLNTDSVDGDLFDVNGVLYAWMAFMASGTSQIDAEQIQSFYSVTSKIIEEYDDDFSWAGARDVEIRIKERLAYGITDLSEDKIPGECLKVAENQVDLLIKCAKELLTKDKFERELEDGEQIRKTCLLFKKLYLLVTRYEQVNDSAIDFINHKVNDQMSCQAAVGLWAIDTFSEGNTQKDMDELVDCVNQFLLCKIDETSLECEFPDMNNNGNSRNIIKLVRRAFESDLDCTNIAYLEKVESQIFELLKEEFK